jgi:hypothetical protein
LYRNQNSLIYTPQDLARRHLPASHGKFFPTHHRHLWDLKDKVILNPNVHIPTDILHLIQSHNINSKTRIPFHIRTAWSLYLKNIDLVTNHCHQHTIPIPPATNFFNANRRNPSSKPCLSKNLLPRKHFISPLLHFIKRYNLIIVQADKTPHICIVDNVLYQNLINVCSYLLSCVFLSFCLQISCQL